MSGFKYAVDENGIATITMDMPGQPVNTMNDAYIDYMDSTLDRLKADCSEKKVIGVIFASAKSTFFAGGDINKILEDKKSAQWNKAFEYNLRLKEQLNKIETLGIPMVAAINGAAMGGGFEICMACHRRIAVDSPKVQVGLPEVSLGLLPAAGGIVRTVRMLGLKKALPILTEGKKFAAKEALTLGLVDALVESPEELISSAKKWIRENSGFEQPWLRKGYRIPGGNAFAPENAAMLAAAPAALRGKTRGLLPAPEAILSVAAESTMVGYKSALTIESRYFSELLQSPVSTSLIKTMFFQMQEVSSGASRPKGIEKKVFKKVGVLGAGMMGRGIAYAASTSGVQVVLKDVTVEAAEKGKDYTKTLIEKQVSKGSRTSAYRDEVLNRIVCTASNSDLADCDIIVEAVFESVELKHQLISELKDTLRKDVIFGSNTSTLPISLLAEAAENKGNFIGLHFFSPVDKMNLVEIICGNDTSAETLAAAYDFVQQIRKSPVVVRDGRGFYTSRVFGCYTDEGIRLLQEGVNPALIENGAKQAGMPVGPLSVMDEVEIELMRKVGVTNQELDKRLNDKFCDLHGEMQKLAIKMCELGRSGRSCGKGFYEYTADGTKSIWSGLSEMFGGETDIPYLDIKDRIIFRQVVETVRCVADGIVSSARDANVGSILGWGFPIHTGGTIQFIEYFGIDNFILRASNLADNYGDRFKLPDNFKDIYKTLIA